jgi:hypothetical protein
MAFTPNATIALFSCPFLVTLAVKGRPVDWYFEGVLSGVVTLNHDNIFGLHHQLISLLAALLMQVFEEYL